MAENIQLALHLATQGVQPWPELCCSLGSMLICNKQPFSSYDHSSSLNMMLLQRQCQAERLHHSYATLLVALGPKPTYSSLHIAQAQLRPQCDAAARHVSALGTKALCLLPGCAQGRLILLAVPGLHVRSGAGMLLPTTKAIANHKPCAVVSLQAPECVQVSDK